MNQSEGPWKLCLSNMLTVHILSFQTEEAANAAEDFYKNVGWHTCVVDDREPEEENAEDSTD